MISLIKYFFANFLINYFCRFLIIILFLFISIASFSQTIYTWNQIGTADFNTPTNWIPDRNIVLGDDILQFNNGAITVVTNVPTQTIGQY